MDPALAREVSLLARAQAINDAIDSGGSQVQQFYKDATILLSGGTGFMGKQLLEKLFRSCDIKKLFLMVRPKKNKGLRERLDLILEDPVFDAVKKMRPGFAEKICPVLGDVAEAGLGISPEDRAAIIAETNVIIHMAATINFDEPLKVAVNTNVRGTVEMLNIGKLCNNLKSFVHISTAYSHATYSRFNQAVDEQFYETALTPQLAIDMVQTMDEKRLKDITPELIQNWPNTYTFTKAIAEEAVLRAGSELPISIVRPAVVISSRLEPTPGWLDLSCAFGHSGMILGCALGMVHTLLFPGHLAADMVPVDLANNAVIVAGWTAAKRRAEGLYEPKIYTVTNRRNSFKFAFLINTIAGLRKKMMTPKSMYYSFVYRADYSFVYLILSWLFHYIPGYIVDFVLWITGRKPMAVKLYTKLDKLQDAYTYFGTHEWVFGDSNLLAMFRGLSETDRLIYNCDIACIEWKEMITTWCLGVRKYLIKDGLQNTEYGVKKQFLLKIFHFTVVAPLYFYLLYKVGYLAFTLLYLTFSTVFSMLLG